MFCTTLEPTHYEFIKKLGYIPVGLGEKNFAGEWIRDNTGKNILLKLDKTSDRESASKYINTDLVIDRTNLPELPHGRYYWNDLEGMQVKNIHGDSLGLISHMIETGSNDVMVLSDDRLIPFVLNDVVKEVDMKNRIMIVEWDWDWN